MTYSKLTFYKNHKAICCCQYKHESQGFLLVTKYQEMFSCRIKSEQKMTTYDLFTINVVDT